MDECYSELGILIKMLPFADKKWQEIINHELYNDISSLTLKIHELKGGLIQQIDTDFRNMIVMCLTNIHVELKQSTALLLKLAGNQAIENQIDSCAELVMHYLNSRKHMSPLIINNLYTKLGCCFKVAELSVSELSELSEFPVKLLRKLVASITDEDFADLKSMSINKCIKYFHQICEILQQWKNLDIIPKCAIKTIIIKIINENINNQYLQSCIKIDSNKNESSVNIIMDVLKELNKIRKYDKSEFLWNYLDNIKKLYHHYITEISKIKTKSAIIIQEKLLQNMNDISIHIHQWLEPQYYINLDLTTATELYRKSITNYYVYWCDQPVITQPIAAIGNFSWKKTHPPSEIPYEYVKQLTQAIDDIILSDSNYLLLHRTTDKFIDTINQIKRVHTANIDGLVGLCEEYRQYLKTKNYESDRLKQLIIQIGYLRFPYAKLKEMFKEHLITEEIFNKCSNKSKFLSHMYYG